MNSVTSSFEHSAVLIVTDQLPYPPRNGITLPIYNYAVGLMKTRVVKILLLVDQKVSLNQKELADNENIFGKIEIISLVRKNRYCRLINEILCSEMYQHGWLLDEQLVDTDSLQADTIIVSPMSAVAKWHSSDLQSRVHCRLSIAAVNDCTTAEYYFRWLQSFGGIKLAIKGGLHRLRSYLIAKIEKKLLAPYQHVLLQTGRDKQLMSELVSEEIASNVVCVPNGIRAEYFSLAPKPEKSKVLLVAELSGEYAPIADWVVNDLWIEVIKRYSQSQLVIVGKGASDTLKRSIKSAKNVTYIEFVDDLGLLYSESTVVLCPIFKGYGLINKTLEAMAASIPVVGGIAAFNGIAGFKPGIHGVVCNSRSSTEFADAIVNLIFDPVRQVEIGTAARSLLIEQFSWEFAVDKINLLITK